MKDHMKENPGTREKRNQKVKVVVDIPGEDPEQTYTYEVPEKWVAEIRVGSRIVVPFGARHVDGFVVEVVDREPADDEHRDEKSPEKAGPKPGKLEEKEQAEVSHKVRQVLDIVYPPLNEELVALAYWLSKKALCSWNEALKLMIPPGGRARYTTMVRLAKQKIDALVLTDEECEILQYIASHEPVPFKKLLARFPQQEKLLLSWRRAGWLEAGNVAERAVRTKTVQVVKLAVPLGKGQEALGQLPPQAVKQRQILAYFLLHPDAEERLPTLLEQFSATRYSVQSLLQQGLLRQEEKAVDRLVVKDVRSEAEHILSTEQQEVLKQVCAALEKRRYHGFLLHGVTGSGKTEVYLQAIARTLSQGREAIVLVPEISLTPQTVRTFKSRFGEQVAVLHSRLSQGERYDEWRKIAEDRVKVAVGARSAVFAPFRHLGLLVIDEEHEIAYKQEATPRYHARDVAFKRARSHQAVVLLGSATPSLESYTASRQGGITLLQIHHRVEDRPHPVFYLADMREELLAGNRGMFSRLLYEKMAARLATGEQVILFLNRRGFSTFVICRACGHTLRCPHCDITLTYHRNGEEMRCHYCGYKEEVPRQCPACGSGHIRYFGTGTQRVESELNRLFPAARVLRMDVDTTKKKGSHERLLSLFERREADVLLGTQMIAKGLDFPGVTLVGVISADTLLHLPDFRAAERTFQLLTQVAGRAGRHQQPGEVVVQSYTPEHYSIQAAVRYDYLAFYRQEMALRHSAGYPPYSRLVLVTFSASEVPKAAAAAGTFVNWLRPRLKDWGQVLGPVASPISRLKDRYRFQCMVKYTDEKEVRPLLWQALKVWRPEMRRQQVGFQMDPDPFVVW